MKRIVLAVACCLAAVVSLSAHAASTGGGPPCVPKVSKLNGLPVVYECGPATATLHVGGKTYTYRHGFCKQRKSTGSLLTLALGTLAPGGKGNDGKPALNLTATSIGGTVGAYQGGKLIANDLVDVSGHIPNQGTFKAKSDGGKPGTTFTGSWNCHGVIWKAP